MSEEVMIDPNASLEAKVEFLLRRNQETHTSSQCALGER